MKPTNSGSRIVQTSPLTHPTTFTKDRNGKDTSAKKKKKKKKRKLFNKVLISSSLSSPILPLCAVGIQLATAKFLLNVAAAEVHCTDHPSGSKCSFPSRWEWGCWRLTAESFSPTQAELPPPRLYLLTGGSPHSKTGSYRGYNSWLPWDISAGLSQLHSKSWNLLSPLWTLYLHPPFLLLSPHSLTRFVTKNPPR